MMRTKTWMGLLFVGTMTVAACGGGSSGGSGGSSSATGSGGGSTGSGGGTTTGSGGGTTTGSGGGTTTGSGGGSTGSGGGSSSSTGTGGSPACPPLAAGTFTYNAQYQVFDGTPMPAIGGADPDIISVELYSSSPTTGTFDLASNGDENYKTCNHCILLLQDATAGGVGKVFFQSAGSMTITATDPSNPTTSTGSITNVTMIEVTIAMDYTSTPVPNGECYTLTAGSWNNGP
jgi:hypothetical protein